MWFDTIQFHTSLFTFQSNCAEGLHFICLVILKVLLLKATLLKVVLVKVVLVKVVLVKVVLVKVVLKVL